MREASLPGQIVLALLVVASLLVWMIWFAKWLQLGRLEGLHKKLERATSSARGPRELVEVAESMRAAPGAQIIRAMAARLDDGQNSADLLAAVARRAITAEEQRAAAQSIGKRPDDNPGHREAAEVGGDDQPRAACRHTEVARQQRQGGQYHAVGELPNRKRRREQQDPIHRHSGSRARTSLRSCRPSGRAISTAS